MCSISEIARRINNKINETKLFILLTNSIDWLIAHSSQGEPYSNSVLIVRLDAIGDFILWLDSAKEFRKLYPDKKIVLCANAVWSGLAERFPYWDEIIAVEENRFRFDIFYRIKLLLFIRRQRFTVAVQPTFSRNLIGDSLIRSTGSQQRIGSQGDLNNISKHDKAISDTWYTKLIFSDDAPLMELKRNAEFVRGLGAENFTSSVAEVRKYFEPPAVLIHENPYYVVFPGALWKYKVWPASNYAELIIRLSKSFGWQVVLCGSLEEKSICDEIMGKSSGVNIKNLAGKTSLVELLEVICGSKMLVGNDTSAIHIAAATGVPSVCILGGGHFGRFLPYELERKGSGPLPTAVIKKMDCYGCDWRCIYPMRRDQPFPCIDSITVDQVEHACIQAASEVPGKIFP